MVVIDAVGSKNLHHRKGGPIEDTNGKFTSQKKRLSHPATCNERTKHAFQLGQALDTMKTHTTSLIDRFNKESSSEAGNHVTGDWGCAGLKHNLRRDR